jgi:hypothetical protein
MMIALDQEGVRSVQAMSHHDAGLYDPNHDSNPFFGGAHGHSSSSSFGLDTLSLEGLKPARMGGAAAPSSQSTSSNKQLDGLSQLRPTFTAVEIPATAERGMLFR